jgi:acyl dehydratase
MLLTTGAYFEDFQEGLEIVTPARTITETDVVAFAGLSGDYHPLHTDDVYAASGPYGKRIAHGLLGLGVTSGLVFRLGVLEKSVLAFRGLECTFKRPICVGDTVHAQLKVLGTRAMPRIDGGLVELRVRLYNQEHHLVQTGRWKVLIKNSPVSGEKS